MSDLNSNNGFSLIELLIVVVVIGLIAAIAIPNLLASRRSSNEASAVSALRTINNAQSAYYSTAGNNNFGTAAQLYGRQMIDRTLAAAHNVNVGGNPVTNTAKSGYRFRIQTTAAAPGTPATFVISAIPATASGITQTGTRRYCVTENGLLKAASTTISTHYTYATCNTAAAFRP